MSAPAGLPFICCLVGLGSSYLPYLLLSSPKPSGYDSCTKQAFCKGKGTSPRSSEVVWTTEGPFVSLSSLQTCFSFSSLPAIQATIPPLVKNSCSCSMMSCCIIPGQLQTVLVPNFLREQVFDVLQDMFLLVKRACEAVGPKDEVRPNAGNQPVSAAGAGGLDSLPRSSEDINLTILSWKVKPACLTELPACCNNKCHMGKKG